MLEKSTYYLRRYFSSTLAFLIFIALKSQTNPPVQNAVQFDLQQQQGEIPAEYIARDKIVFSNGYSFAAESGKKMIARIDPSQTFSLQTIPEHQYQSTEQYEINTNLNVGSINGVPDVSAGGASVYTIPIFTPPGTAGIEPQISISYNSQSGNGVAGFGWHIAGLSLISRTNKTQYFDNNSSGINVSGSDALTLDGKRLLSLPNNMYITETNNFEKIKYNTQDDYFIVQTKEGLTYEYGNTVDSKLKPANSLTITWYLNKIVDKYGNYMHFKYHNFDNKEIQVSEILYTGNTQNEPYNKIRFYYDKRDLQDKNEYYISGKKLIFSKILTKIKVISFANEVRNYNFKYFFDGIVAKLYEVKVQDENKQELNPIRIEYGNADFSNTTNPLPITLFPIVYNTYSSIIIKGDFNGDGIMDFARLVLITVTPSGYSSSFIVLSKIIITSGKDFSIIAQKDFPVDINNNIADVFSYSLHYHHPWLQTGDFDGDGKSDILLCKERIFNNSSSKYVVRLHIFSVAENQLIEKYTKNLHGYNATNNDPGLIGNILEKFAKPIRDINYLTIGDFDGDGTTDILIPLSQDYPLNNICNTYLISPSKDKEYIFQVSGSNNTDVFKEIFMYGKDIIPLNFRYSNGPQQLLVIYDTPVPVSRYDFNNNTTTNYNAVTSRIFDLELLPYDGGSFEKFTYHINFNENFLNKNHLIYGIADFNGDGLSDILYGSKSSSNINVDIAYSKGKNEFFNKFFNSFNIDENFDDDWLFVNYVISCGDFNGDGKSDVFAAKFKIEGIGSPVTGELNGYCKYFTSKKYFSKGIEFYSYDDDIDIIACTAGLGSDYLYIFNMDRIFTGNFDGNNKDDICLIDISSNIDIFKISPVPDNQFLVKKIIDGSLKKTIFEYKTLTDNDVYFPSATFVNEQGNRLFPMYVVSSIKISNGIEDHLNETSYNYYALKYSVTKKQLLGFCQTKVINTTQSRTYYSTSKFNVEKQILLPFSSQTIGNNPDDFGIVQNTSFIHEYRFHNHPNTNNKAFFLYPYHSEEINNFTNTKKVIYSDYNSDGNLSEQRIFLSLLANSQPDKSITSNFEYIDPINFGKPCRILNRTITETSDNQAPFVSLTNFQYNSNGKTTVEEDVNSGLIRNFEDYNEFGFPEKIRITSNDEPERFSISKYDSYGRFVICQTDAAGKSVSYKYDNPSGLLKKKTDIFGNTTQFEYDTWGRLVNTISPFAENTTFQYLWSLGQPYPNALYLIKERTGNEPEKILYYDKIEREIANEITMYGKKVKTLYFYNDMGQATFQLGPSYPIPYILGTEIFPDVTSYEYYENGDNRLKKTNYNGLITQYGYNGNEMTTTDPAGRTFTKNFDATGKTSQVQYPLNNSLSFQYASHGQPVNITANQINTSMTYNPVSGRQDNLIEPNSGTTNYLYNNFGELKEQTDAKNNIYLTHYDNLGQISSVDGPEGTTNTEYITDGNGIGNIKIITDYKGNSIEFGYNEHGIVTNEKMKIDIDNINLESQTGYNSLGYISDYTFPNNFQITYIYNTNNELTGLKRTDNNEIIWQCTDYTSKLQPENIYLGTTNSLLKYEYDDFYRVIKIKYNTAFEWSYIWNNQTGNLISRTDIINDLNENFTYDALNRLISWKVNNETEYVVSYDNNGNILSKTDAGIFEYEQNKPHAVRYISNFTENISRNTQTIEYTPFNKVKRITETDVPNNVAHILDIEYGPDNRRWKSEYKKINLTNNDEEIKYTRYYGLNYEIEKKGSGEITEHCYINGPNGLIAVYIAQNGVGNLYYTITDHLGSIVAIADEQGNIVEQTGYDTWGRTRNALTWTYNNPQPLSLIYRGFTGHEMLPEFQLINMNGRMYDPVIGRFLSPDNYVQNPENPQGYNRYSYCLNNPLVYVDPSGDNPILIPVIIGMAIGGYAGYQIGHAQGATGAELIGYTFFGSVIGGLSGFIGGTISASGGFMANTIGTMVGSTLHSVGMSGISGGMIQPNISFGVASYNFGTGKLGYLGKKGNEWYQDFGYSLGLLANLGDVSSHVLARTKINYARKYYEASLEASTSNIPRPTTEDEWILFANKIAYKDVGGNPGDIISYGQDSPLYSKLSNLTNDELAKTWSLDETFNPGARSSSELFNTGLKLKYYPFKQGIPDAIGLVRANYTMHIIEAGLEFFESLFYADDALYDMHLINSISYIYGR